MSPTVVMKWKIIMRRTWKYRTWMSGQSRKGNGLNWNWQTRKVTKRKSGERGRKRNYDGNKSWILKLDIWWKWIARIRTKQSKRRLNKIRHLPSCEGKFNNFNGNIEVKQHHLCQIAPEFLRSHCQWIPFLGELRLHRNKKTSKFPSIPFASIYWSEAAKQIPFSLKESTHWYFFKVQPLQTSFLPSQQSRNVTTYSTVT